MFLATPPKRTLFLTGLAALLGVAGGAAAWLLLQLIDLITNFAVFGELDMLPRSFATFEPGPRLFVAAVTGALIVSLLAKWAPTLRGHGIPEAMDAVMTKQSRIQPRTALAKPLASAVAIGTAAPFGAEGPIIVTGGSLGSLLGQIIKVSPSERKILLACGAAAGMSATFGLRIGRHFGLDPFTTTQIRQIMTSRVETLPVEATAGVARRRFLDVSHGALPLVDSDDRVVGIVARGDLLRSDAPDEAPVRELSSRDVVSVGPGDSALSALHLMIDEGVEHLPVIDQERLVGICTRSDLMRIRRDQLAHESPQTGELPAVIAAWRRNARKR